MARVAVAHTDLMAKGGGEGVCMAALELVGLLLSNPVDRLAHYKNVEETIRIVDGVRERGYDVYHHIVASSYDRDYRRKLEAMVAELDSISLEGDSRTRNSSACSVRTATDSTGMPRALRNGSRRTGCR